jgi:hypothetical protein
MIKRHDETGIFQNISAYESNYYTEEIRPEECEILDKYDIPECGIEAETSSLENKPEC